jgi:hypothetical protein
MQQIEDMVAAERTGTTAAAAAAISPTLLWQTVSYCLAFTALACQAEHGLHPSTRSSISEALQSHLDGCLQLFEVSFLQVIRNWVVLLIRGRAHLAASFPSLQQYQDQTASNAAVRVLSRMLLGSALEGAAVVVIGLHAAIENKHHSAHPQYSISLIW